MRALITQSCFQKVLSEKLVEIALFYRFRRRMELKKTAQSYNFVFVCVEYRLMARKVRSFIIFCKRKICLSVQTFEFNTCNQGRKFSVFGFFSPEKLSNRDTTSNQPSIEYISIILQLFSLTRALQGFFPNGQQ